MSSPLTKDLLKAEEVSSSVGIADDVLRPNFYRQENWLEKLCESMFTIKDRGTSIKSECYFGLIQFVSCVYILPVVSSQLVPAGFDADKNVVVTSAVTGMGCIISGLLTNLPMIVAPTPSVSIFYSVYLQENNLRKWEGNQAVCVAGVCLSPCRLCRFKDHTRRKFPPCAKASTWTCTCLCPRACTCT